MFQKIGGYYENFNVFFNGQQKLYLETNGGNDGKVADSANPMRILRVNTAQKFQAVAMGVKSVKTEGNRIQTNPKTILVPNFSANEPP